MATEYTAEDAGNDTSEKEWEVSTHEANQAWHNARNDYGTTDEAKNDPTWTREMKEYLDNKNVASGYYKLFHAIMDEDYEPED